MRRSPAPLPPSMAVENNTHLLEINLISAQGLKPPTGIRRLKSYAIAWIHPSIKLRTRIDCVGSENPTWNDKFIFRVNSDFLSGDTSAVNVEIYAVGLIKDHFLGSVRLLLSNLESVTSPSIIAVQIRRNSGRFHGVLNLGAMIIEGSGFETLDSVSAIGYHDLMGKNHRRKHRRGFSSGSWGGDSSELSDGTESTASSSSSTTVSNVLKEANGERTKLAGKREKEDEDEDEDEGKENDEGVILCGLGFQKKVHIRDIRTFGSSDLDEF